MGYLFYQCEVGDETPAENEVAPIMLLAAESNDNISYNLNATATLAQGLTTSGKTFAVGKINFETLGNGQGSVSIDDVKISGSDTPLDKVEIVTGGEPVSMRAI